MRRPLLLLPIALLMLPVGAANGASMEWMARACVAVAALDPSVGDRAPLKQTTWADGDTVRVYLEFAEAAVKTDPIALTCVFSDVAAVRPTLAEVWLYPNCDCVSIRYENPELPDTVR